MGRVADAGCVVCREQGEYVPAMVHHPITLSMGRGHGKKAPDWLSYGLCHYHHQGVGGIHTIGLKAFEMRNGTEAELLAKNLEYIYGE